eukprot:1232817-Amphidinium_carterae.1
MQLDQHHAETAEDSDADPGSISFLPRSSMATPTTPTFSWGCSGRRGVQGASFPPQLPVNEIMPQGNSQIGSL